MKLGLIIKCTNNGEQEVFVFNKKEEWAMFTMDTRSIIKDLNGFDGSGKYVIIAKILGKLGYLLAVVKARPENSGRPYDNTTAWIHVPANIKITGEQLCAVITGVKQQLSAPIGIDSDSLNKLFSTDYPEKDVLFTALAFIKYNPNGIVGWRQYGQGTGYELHELLGDSIAQTYYKEYKCICFTDTSLKLSMVEGEAIIRGVKPISKREAPDNKDGFRPFIIGNADSYIPFDKDIEYPADARVRAAWKKEGYKDIIKEINLDIQESDIKFLLQRSWIRVKDSRFNTLTDAEIFVNDTPFTKSEMEVPQTALQYGIKIRVTHDGYETKEETRLISHNIEIRLNDEHYREVYTLRPKDGNGLRSDAQITVNTDNYAISGSPFKGYRKEGNCIVYEDNIILKIKCFALGAATILALWLLWAGYKAVDNWADNHTIKWGWPPKIEKVKKPSEGESPKEVVTDQKDSPKEEADTTKDSQIEHVRNYLEANKIWRRDSLCQYNLTKNLFDNMNSFNLTELVKLNESELKDIERIRQLREAAYKAIQEHINPNIGKEKHEGKYNAAADFSINIANYISWITKQHDSYKDATTDKAGKPNTPSNKKQEPEKKRGSLL